MPTISHPNNVSSSRKPAATLHQATLHQAARTGSTAMALTCLKNEHDLNQPTPEGNTPLHLAIYHNQPEVTKILLEAGANPHLKNNQQQTALDLAHQPGRSKLIEYMSKLCPTPLASPSPEGTSSLSSKTPNPAASMSKPKRLWSRLFSSWLQPVAKETNQPAKPSARPTSEPRHSIESPFLTPVETEGSLSPGLQASLPSPTSTEMKTIRSCLESEIASAESAKPTASKTPLASPHQPENLPTSQSQTSFISDLNPFAPSFQPSGSSSGARTPISLDHDHTTSGQHQHPKHNHPSHGPVSFLRQQADAFRLARLLEYTRIQPLPHQLNVFTGEPYGPWTPKDLDHYLLKHPHLVPSHPPKNWHF